MYHTLIKTIGYVTDVIENSFFKYELQAKRSHHLIKLLMLIGVSIQKRLSLQKCHRLKM